MPPVDRLKPTRGRSSESSCSLMEFMREFPDDNACLEYLWRTRHSADGETAHCPKCDQGRTFKHYKTTQRRQSWTCIACGHHVHPTAGTIFHKSSTSLHQWFYAMYLMTSTRCGISAKQVERELACNYKTAARMMRQIRTLMDDQDGDTPLEGDVESAGEGLVTSRFPPLGVSVLKVPHHGSATSSTEGLLRWANPVAESSCTNSVRASSHWYCPGK